MSAIADVSAEEIELRKEVPHSKFLRRLLPVWGNYNHFINTGLFNRVKESKSCVKAIRNGNK